MEGTLAFETWLMLCIAPAFIGWIAGELYGRRRSMRKRDSDTQKTQPLMFAAPPMPRRRAGAPTQTVVPSNVPKAKPPQPEAPLGRPTFRDLREEAQAIRAAGAGLNQSDVLNVLPATPLAARAIEDYRFSIAALRQINRRHQRIGAQPDPVFDQLPRISDAAPLSPDFLPDQLMVHRIAPNSRAKARALEAL